VAKQIKGMEPEREEMELEEGKHVGKKRSKGKIARVKKAVGRKAAKKR